MKRSHRDGERFDAREISNAAFTASMFAASVGMIWDLATGHVSAFDRMLSNISEDDYESRAGSSSAPSHPSAPRAASISGPHIHSIARGSSSNG
jgi:hypothetical protein